MIDFNAAELEALKSNQRSIGIFFRMEWEPEPIRLWLGVGECQVGINAYDDAGGLYRGFGELQEVPAIQSLINGVADRGTFYISGVSAETLKVASGELANLNGNLTTLGICVFNLAWQQLGSIKWLWRGQADSSQLTEESDNAGGFVRRIELSTGSLFVGRRRRGYSYLTDHDQRARYPTDLGCERCVLYTQEARKVWPRF